MASNKMKICKTCGTEIAKSAKVCPKCGAKQKKPVGLIILAVVVVIGLIGAFGSGGNNKSSGGSSSSSQSAPAAAQQNEAVEETITYTEVGIAEMLDALEKNAAAAHDQYIDQYVAVTGRLSNIDAQGSYISIDNPDDTFSFMSCQCYIKGKQEISDIVKTLSKGDIITVKGKITDVGEVLGYSMNIDAIEQ